MIRVQPPPTAAFAALSDTTRCRLVSRLSYGPATAGQLAALAATTRPAVSQHLKVLRDRGLIRGSRQGKFIWYELDGEALVEAEHWLRGLADAWGAGPMLRANEVRSNPPTRGRDDPRQLRRAQQS